MVDPPICFSYFLVLASGLAGHALSSRSRVALQHGEDQKAAVGRSGDQRYQSKRSLLSGNRVITRLLPRRNPGECRATGARLLVRQESSLACCRDLPRAPLAIPVGAGLRQAECVNFMYPLTRYAVRGGGENVLLSSASLAHAPILVAGCNRTSFAAPSLSSFMSIQKLSRSFPALCFDCFIVPRCFPMNSFPSFSRLAFPRF